jgi:pseudouridine synthase
VPRVYRATIRPGMSQAEIDALMAGVKIDDGLTVVRQAASLVESGPRWTTVEITLTEGRNHVVRPLFRARARRVLALRRTRFGPFELGELEPGGWREADPMDPRAR